MLRLRPCSFALPWAVAALLGLVAAACSGARVSSNQVFAPPAGGTVVLVNSSSSQVEVLCARSLLGVVPPATTGRFPAPSGVHPVHLRRAGESALRYYGDWTISGGVAIELRFDPGYTFNLEVWNTQREGLHVLVDGLEVGQAPAGEQIDLRVAPGLHDVSVRKQFETRLFPLGSFDLRDGPPPTRVVF